MAMITEILLDTLMDVARLVPFLFLTYLLMEWMEHQTDGAFESFLENTAAALRSSQASSG